MRGSDVVEERSVGLTGGSGSQPCSPRSRFQACSISKLVLSSVVLSLVESGALDLQRPITAWLEDLPSSWSSITLHHLLSNTSGLGHWGDIPGLPQLLTAPPPQEELLALIRRRSPGRGSRRRLALQRARLPHRGAGRRSRDRSALRHDRRAPVFTPAGMAATSSGAAPADPDVAVGHDHGRPWPLHPNFADITGSGDLWTTTGDLVRLGQVLRAGQLLATQSATQLWTGHTALPATSAANPEPVVVTGYGYGTFLGRVRGHQARINPGDMPGYQTLLAYLPDQELDLAVLCNEEAPSLNAALTELQLPDLAAEHHPHTPHAD